MIMKGVKLLMKFSLCLIFILVSFTKPTHGDSDDLSEVFNEIADIRVTQKVIVDRVNGMMDTMRSLEQISMEFDSLMSLSYDIGELKQAVTDIEGKMADGSKDKVKVKNGSGDRIKPNTHELTEVERLREELLILKDDLQRCRLELTELKGSGCAKDEDTRYRSESESSTDSCKGRKET